MASEVAVLIPSWNEGKTIGAVVRDFRAALPGSVVYVCDNNSTDDTWDEAHRAGAVLLREPRQGKGWVVRRMFAEIDANWYVLVDGDGTYEHSAAPQLLKLAQEGGVAMLVGKRVHQSARAYRWGHASGNRLFSWFIAKLFGSSLADIFSGYRVFSRAFVKSFPVFSSGFEIESELTVHALTLGIPVAEVETVYKERPDGSLSKLNTYRDGARILWKILVLFKNEKPMMFFGILSAVCMATAFILAYPVVVAYLETGLVPRFPTAILATGIAVYALIMFACGLILDNVTKARREMKLLAYLSVGLNRNI